MDNYYIWPPIIFGILGFAGAVGAGVFFGQSRKWVSGFFWAGFAFVLLGLSGHRIYEIGKGQPITQPNRLVVGYIYETVWHANGNVILQGIDGTRRYYLFSETTSIPPKRFTVLANGTLKPLE
jgi:hypothetical protein